MKGEGKSIEALGWNGCSSCLGLSVGSLTAKARIILCRKEGPFLGDNFPALNLVFGSSRKRRLSEQNFYGQYLGQLLLGRYAISCVCLSTTTLENSRAWVGCWLVFGPHLCENPVYLSAFNSPLNNSQSVARQGGSFHCCEALGLAVASVDMENPGANKRGITHRLHPRTCHRDFLPWGSGLKQCKQWEPIIIKVFKISASVILLKKT